MPPYPHVAPRTLDNKAEQPQVQINQNMLQVNVVVNDQKAMRDLNDMILNTLKQ